MKPIRRFVRKKIFRPIILFAVLFWGLYATSDQWEPHLTAYLYKPAAEVKKKSREPKKAGKQNTAQKDAQEKKSETPKNTSTEDHKYRDTVSDVRKTIKDTKKAADGIKDFLSDAKQKGSPVIKDALPGINNEKPKVIQDGIDTVSGIKDRVKYFLSEKAEDAKEHTKSDYAK